VPLNDEDAQTIIVPVGMSVTVNSPDVREIGPPGRTVQVVAAKALVTPVMATRTAAKTAARARAWRLVTGP
jgi:hypothetical protein